ncbi:hypothetical protein HYW20_01035 [Candidatus Woesearchaeota archaeon]|nr:hypothetical protein [Candidatus Woesearchaeota archaeon]
MYFKNLLVSIVKSLIVFVVVMLVFSLVAFEFPSLAKGLFGDIFQYASPEVQKHAISRLAETCSSLDQGKKVVTINQICANSSLLESMQENCKDYRALVQQGVQIENEEQVKETCRQLESGEIESACNGIRKNALLPDFSSIGQICRDYKAGKIDDKVFFFNVLGSQFSSMQMEAPKIGLLDKYKNATDYLNNNRIIYFVILAILLMGLYSLIMDAALFWKAMGGILLNLGMIIMLPYFAVLVYDKFVGINTTSILGSMFGTGNGIEPKALISVILLLFLRTYNALIITIGIVFLTIGVISVTSQRLYSGYNKREVKKKDKNVDKLFSDLKESMEKEK